MIIINRTIYLFSPPAHRPFWTKWHTRAHRSSALWKGWDVITFRLCFICPFLFGILNHVSPLLFSFFLCQLICIIFFISLSLSPTLSLLYWERERRKRGKRNTSHAKWAKWGEQSLSFCFLCFRYFVILTIPCSMVSHFFLQLKWVYFSSKNAQLVSRISTVSHWRSDMSHIFGKEIGYLACSFFNFLLSRPEIRKENN